MNDSQDAELNLLRSEARHLRDLLGKAEVRSDARLAVLEKAPVAIEIYDKDGVAEFLNQAMVDFLGIPSPELAIGKFNILTDPMSVESGLAALFERAYAGKIVEVPEFEIDLGQGISDWESANRVACFDVLAYPVLDSKDRVTSVVGFVRETTERKRMAAALLESQKHQGISLLAGGVAHDFNNLLSTIVGNASLAIHRGPNSAEVTHSLEQILQAGETAARLTQQLLAYAGQGKMESRSLELSELVAETVALYKKSLTGKIAISLDLAEDLGRIDGDELQLRQVVLTLLTNAVEAISTNHGKITVSTSRITADAVGLAYAFPSSGLVRGEYVCLAVADDGCGIPKDAAGHIFQPFYTTKSNGQGLGLASALGIVTAHSGGIRAESHYGRGTTLQLLLPIGRSEKPDSDRDERPPTRSATVLVVDDEQIVLDLAERALVRGGYEVITAENGQLAIDSVGRLTPQIDLVLMDLSMPVMGGIEAYRAIRELRPDLPVLFSTGCADSGFVGELEGIADACFIRKPYPIRELLDRVGKLLESTIAA